MGNQNQNWRAWDVFSVVFKQREIFNEEMVNRLGAELCSS
jgi:hypothetical protein